MDQIQNLEQLIQTGDFAGALDQIETMSLEERQQWKIQNLTGIVCASCGQPNEARTFFEAALEQQPQDPELLYNLADTYITLGMDRKAKELIAQCQQYTDDKALLDDIASLRQRLAEQKGGRVLMAAYYFPPLSGSGVFRSIKFAKYLPQFGWQPTVISTDRPPNGWNFADESQLKEIPDGMEVVRIPDGLSTGRETSLGSARVQAILDFLRDVLRYSPEADRIFYRMAQSKEGIVALLTFPCNALSWAYDTVQYIEENLDLEQYQVVYTTSGPSSAHLIGFYLKQKYGIPWVADYRDQWTFNPYGATYDPSNARQRLLFELESVLLHHADCNLTIEKSLIQSYTQQFQIPKEKIVSITNGYDEADFSSLPTQKSTQKFIINYSGLLYTQQRSIAPVLKALQQLGSERKLDLSKVEFRIVGMAEQGNIEVVKQYGLEEIIVQTGYVSHQTALEYNLNADLLLLLVGDEAQFKPIYTGKFFDYLRSGRPILALAPKNGAIDRVLRETGHGEAHLSTQISEIKKMILREYQAWQSGKAAKQLCSPKIQQFERKALTGQLANVLSSVVSSHNSLPVSGSEAPACRSAKYLVICNGGYPREGDPRCMFAHKRVLQYIDAGLDVEAFGFIWDAPLTEYTYQGVNVVQGGAPVLQKLLQSKNYEKLLIHFVDAGVIYAIQQAGKLDMPMVIWCHGYEVSKWNRVYFNYSQEEINSNKKSWNDADTAKANLLKQLFLAEHIHFIFMSNWMKERIKRCVGQLPLHYEIIPNFIDCDFYKMDPKDSKSRTKILSIKSHAAKTYANDLTAKAILELSNKEFFSNLEFELYGTGSLFEQNFGVLLEQHFPNVKIRKIFLTADEMRTKFKENGILISPTRCDTQGVTACEAMSAGLAVISCNTAAIPEFINEDCGSLYEFDNYFQIADEIEYLYFHPEEFLRKSKNAVKRIRTQCSYDATIRKEIQIITALVPIDSKIVEQASSKETTENNGLIKSLKTTHQYVRDPNTHFCSRDYWESRYAHGGTSGSGSYNRLAKFKAEVINQFISTHRISSIIEWGCGDGNQLGLFLPVSYIGYDMSETIIERCKSKYPSGNKTFIWYDGSRQNVKKRELALSLDVIYHLIEDEVFENYMYNLFMNSERYVCIYSSNYDLDIGLHQKNRNFTEYIKHEFSEWRQIDFIKNKYPYDSNDPENTSMSDFYIYEHR